MPAFESRYISAGGNRHPSAADWDHTSGLLAYGADINVAIWDAVVSGASVASNARFPANILFFFRLE